MSCFLYTNDDDALGKIDIDELYEKKQKRDLKQVSIFNKILNRVHHRIRLTGRQKTTDKHIWFVVPEYIFGEPVYDKADCIAYLVSKLEANHFHIRYLHPNTLFVSWENWIPSYVRAEFKKKTGNTVDEYGNITEKTVDDENDPNNTIFNKSGGGNKPQKEYTPIDKYKPTGNLVYNPEMFEKIEKRVSFA
jgi:hypothetical protein